MNCSYCGKPLGKHYVIVSDEWLQDFFFDDKTTFNCFCDRLCLCEFIQVVDVLESVVDEKVIEEQNTMATLEQRLKDKIFKVYSKNKDARVDSVLKSLYNLCEKPYKVIKDEIRRLKNNASQCGDKHVESMMLKFEEYIRRIERQ